MGYYDTIHLIERLHRHFLHVLKLELDRVGLKDVTNVQSLILYNIGDAVMTVGELTARGCYLGSNVSYNVKRMVENGYLVQERSRFDRRSSTVRLSEKGMAVREAVADILENQASELAEFGVTPDGFQQLNDTLLRLQRFYGSRTEMPDLATYAA